MSMIWLSRSGSKRHTSMTRLITKKMRDSFKVLFECRINKLDSIPNIGGRWKAVCKHFQSTEKQRILILRRTVK